MELSRGTVDAHFELMTDPKKHGLPFRPLKECFEESPTATAQHILFRDYQSEVPQARKIFFYIVMEMIYGPARYKDADGNLGFMLRFVVEQGSLKV